MQFNIRIVQMICSRSLHEIQVNCTGRSLGGGGGGGLGVRVDGWVCLVSFLINMVHIGKFPNARERLLIQT